MTKQEILDILDKNAASSRNMIKFAIVAGVLMLGGSVAVFIYVEDGRIMWGSILALLGVAAIFGSVRRLTKDTYEKEAANIKDIFNNRPQDLVWSYTLAIKGNVATTKQVILKFRDGTEFEIDEDVIPEGDTNALVSALTVINPNMIVGYSEETEQRYKNKQL